MPPSAIGQLTMLRSPSTERTRRCRLAALGRRGGPGALAPELLVPQQRFAPGGQHIWARTPGRVGGRLPGGQASGAPHAAAPSGKRGPKKRMRLDEHCMQLAPQYSRNVIQTFILLGKVRVGDKVVTKAGTPVVVEDASAPQVVIDAEQPKYVCRAGVKLEKALEHWGIDVRGVTALDSGQSTGGFTDCLLQYGAAKVYGIDVGHSQLADKIRRDERVVVMEKFNLRHLGPQHLPCQVDIATLDLSFISLLLVIGGVTSVLRPDGRLVALIKPQFEAGRKQVGAGGVVRDPKVHAEVLQRITTGIVAHGYELVGVTESPIKGDKSGNTEFLAYFLRRPELATLAAASAAVAAAEADVDEAGEPMPTQ
ncbi:putative rRNA methyltransferase YqxC [Tetrabaena socialis]|uniref:Putative rRNA methyltransferase YqxC n=1 Tax=Tetrabaena socialis TaxID=47790 RepID=A0A2J8AJK9_9CHLO|nr:putative rRNA methyltransferase YqxC [Tetrabaena socialis]|eukprot:PNH12707.1 putative rRNA methyltransferase YqxC [Tetrabaena socialis]